MTRPCKSDLIDASAENRLMRPVDVRAIVDDFLGEIGAAFLAGHSLQVHKFGTFEPRARAARIRRHPQTGAPVEIAASTTLGFKAANLSPGAGVL